MSFFSRVLRGGVPCGGEGGNGNRCCRQRAGAGYSLLGVRKDGIGEARVANELSELVNTARQLIQGGRGSR